LQLGLFLLIYQSIVVVQRKGVEVVLLPWGEWDRIYDTRKQWGVDLAIIVSKI